MVATSNYSGDVPDQLRPRDIGADLWDLSMCLMALTKSSLEHWSVAQDCNSPNSVVPTSVCNCAVPYMCSTPPSLCDANISNAYRYLVPVPFVHQTHGQLTSII